MGLSKDHHNLQIETKQYSHIVNVNIILGEKSSFVFVLSPRKLEFNQVLQKRVHHIKKYKAIQANFKFFSENILYNETMLGNLSFTF